MFIASASLFGVVIAQLNDILAKQAPITLIVFCACMRTHALCATVRREGALVQQYFRLSVPVNLCECELLL